jgi:hypothetical protein
VICLLNNHLIIFELQRQKIIKKKLNFIAKIFYFFLENPLMEIYVWNSVAGKSLTTTIESMKNCDSPSPLDTLRVPRVGDSLFVCFHAQNETRKGKHYSTLFFPAHQHFPSEGRNDRQTSAMRTSEIVITFGNASYCHFTLRLWAFYATVFLSICDCFKRFVHQKRKIKKKTTCGKFWAKETTRTKWMIVAMGIWARWSGNWIISE